MYGHISRNQRTQTSTSKGCIREVGTCHCCPLCLKLSCFRRFPAIIKSKEKIHISAFHGDAPPITHDEIDVFAKTPIIKAAGGVAGLGLDQFSDNDRFSTIIKFLINYDQFRAVGSSNPCAISTLIRSE